ncbi:hypothetical protein HPSA20_0876 [Helicobacter pylori SouthAfrica20]|uniref:Uncharacterized protein n=1 Tax=Helicobacter pylori SouthAfrica20 TaxID=1352356 RepID=T1UB16_HELPX|nr:hypothetical protein HPSA20_0876 [Helicobacter pylori SouthAfrica20]
MITKFKNASKHFYNQHDKRTCLSKRQSLKKRSLGDLVGGCRGKNYFTPPSPLKSFMIKQSLKTI